MKQFILNYKDFLLKESVLTPKQAKKYSKIQVVKEVKEIHDKIFGDQERIYLPFDPSLFNISLSKSKLQETIEELLTSNGYEIVSYTQNQCVKTGQKNITKIGKVLVSKNINRKDLADSYGQEVDKLKAVKDSSDLLVVFSRNYDDIASMSTEKAWNSCQNLIDGTEKHFVAKDLKQGSIIAYLIKSTDKEILDPEARILIKPFINIENVSDIVLLPCTKTYHRGTNEGTPLTYPKFPEFVMGWVREVQPNINGTYKMNDKVYQDGDTTLKIKKHIMLSKEEMERALNPKTVEDLKLSFKYYDIVLDISKVQMDSNGLWAYNGDIDFSENKEFIEIPKCFKYLKEIKGNFDCSKSKLKSFVGLENLQSVIGRLDCSATNITSFEGLENLQSVIGSLYFYDTNITSFEGLKNLQTIGGSLGCSYTPLESFKGLENLQTIGKNLDCSNTSITSFERLKRLEKIGGDLWCYNTNITSFRGLSKGFKIDGDIKPEELQELFNQYKNS